MKIIFVVTLLNALFWFATLGLVFSLARESKLERYTPIAAAALWPAFMVLSQSMAGYLRAEHFSPAVAIGTIAAAMIWTGWTLHHYRKQYAEMDWTAAASVIAVSLLAGCLVILPHIWNNDFGYSEFSNGEFLNYSQLASFSLGLQTSPDPVKWERYHQATRDGVDFINATVATLTQQQPVHIVQLTAALLRSAYLAGILLLVRTVLADVRFPTLATAAIGVVVAFNNLDLFQFETSFLAASLSLSLAICAAALVVTPALPRLPSIVLYVVLNIALLVSYPEAMVVLKIVEILFVIERSAGTREYEIAKRWLMGNLAIVAINPLLVLQKIAYAYAATFSEGGWNVIAEPRTASISYISRLVGIEPIYLSSLALFHAKWLIIVIALTTSLIGLAFVFGLARHVKCYALLLVPAAITAFHVLPFLGLRPHFYSAAKLVLAWSWLLPVGLAACYVGGSQKLRAALVIAICLFAGANMETFRRAKSKLIELDTFKSAAESDQVVGIIRQTAGSDSQIVLKSNDPVAGLYWFQVLDNHALATRRNLVQAKYFSRDAVQSDLSFDAPADAPTIVIRPNFAFAWQMPNTDLWWAQLPESRADDTLYRSRLLSLSIEHDRANEPDLNAELK